MIVLESFTGIVVSETQLNALLIALGIGTTAGTSNAVLSNKQQIKELLEKLKNGWSFLEIPSFCYTKIFLLVLASSLSFASALGVTAINGIYADIDEVKKQSQENTTLLEKRAEAIELIPSIYKNQIILCTHFKISECIWLL